MKGSGNWNYGFEEKIKLANREIILSSSKTVNNAELEFFSTENFSYKSEHIREDVGRHALVNDIKAARQKSQICIPNFPSSVLLLTMENEITGTRERDYC